MTTFFYISNSYQENFLFIDTRFFTASKVILNITHNLSDLNSLDGEYFLFEEYDIKKYSSRKELIDLYIHGGTSDLSGI